MAPILNGVPAPVRRVLLVFSVMKSWWSSESSTAPFAAGDGNASTTWSCDCGTCGLSFQQRVLAFGVCCGAGVLISFLSVFALGNVVTFAKLYTLGNVTSLASTLFLMGPMRQLRRMCDSTRALTTCVYCGAIVATLTIAIWQGRRLLTVVVVLLCVQAVAGVWYALSYIPFARACITRAARSYCC